MKSIGALAVCAIVLGACSADDSPGAPAAPGALVEIDPGGGESRIELPSEQEDDVGAESTEVPASFPMPIPEGGEVVNTIVSSALGREDFHVTLTYPVDRLEWLRELYRAWLTDAGFEVEASDAGSELVQLSGLGNRASASVMIAVQDGRLFVSLTYSE